MEDKAKKSEYELSKVASLEKTENKSTKDEIRKLENMVKDLKKKVTLAEN